MKIELLKFFFVLKKIEIGPSIQNIAWLYLMLEISSNCSMSDREDSKDAKEDSL